MSNNIMTLELDKMAVALSPQGALWRGVVYSANKQAQLITEYAKRDHGVNVSPTMVRSWHRRGVSNHAAEGIAALCEAFRAQCHIEIQPEDFTETVSWSDFLEKMGVQEFEAKRLKASFFINSKYHIGQVHDFYDLTPTDSVSRDPIHGIFRLDRYPLQPKQARAFASNPSSTALLIVNSPIEWKEIGRSAPFVMLFAPTGNDVEEIAEYAGLLARYNHSIYLTLKGIPPTKLGDMCQIILMATDGAKYAAMKGTYASANIEQTASPGMRWAKAERLTTRITDKSIEKYKEELVGIHATA